MAMLPMVGIAYVAPEIDLSVDVKRAVALLKAFPDALTDELQARAPGYLAEVRPHMPLDKGGVQRSGTVTNTRNGATISFTVPAQKKVLRASYRAINGSVLRAVTDDLQSIVNAVVAKARGGVGGIRRLG